MNSATREFDSESVYREIIAVTNLWAVRPGGRTKLTGALAIEVIRRRLLDAGLPASTRDVFIKGYATEFDLLIPRSMANPLHGIVYEPSDVAVVLEIKFSGVYSRDVPIELRRLFEGIKLNHPHIQCAYLTVCENPDFKYKMTTECLGSRAFTLNWWTNYKKTSVRGGDAMSEVFDYARVALSQLPAKLELDG